MVSPSLPLALPSLLVASPSLPLALTSLLVVSTWLLLALSSLLMVLASLLLALSSPLVVLVSTACRRRPAALRTAAAAHTAKADGERRSHTSFTSKH